MGSEQVTEMTRSVEDTWPIPSRVVRCTKPQIKRVNGAETNKPGNHDPHG